MNETTLSREVHDVSDEDIKNQIALADAETRNVLVKSFEALSAPYKNTELRIKEELARNDLSEQRRNELLLMEFWIGFLNMVMGVAVYSMTAQTVVCAAQKVAKEFAKTR